MTTTNPTFIRVERHVPDGFNPDKPGLRVEACAHVNDDGHLRHGVMRIKLSTDYALDINVDTTREGIEAIRDACNSLLVQVP